MKRFSLTAPLLCLLLLLGCARVPARFFPTPAAQKPPSARSLLKIWTEEREPLFVFTRENFPRLDGSTSTVPLAQAAAAVLLGESREEVSDLTRFSRTTQSYRNLILGDRKSTRLNSSHM